MQGHYLNRIGGSVKGLRSASETQRSGSAAGRAADRPLHAVIMPESFPSKSQGAYFVTLTSCVAHDDLEALTVFGMFRTFPYLATTTLNAPILGAVIDAAQRGLCERRSLIDVDKVLAAGALIAGAANFHRLLVPGDIGRAWLTTCVAPGTGN